MNDIKFGTIERTSVAGKIVKYDIDAILEMGPKKASEIYDPIDLALAIIDLRMRHYFFHPFETSKGSTVKGIKDYCSVLEECEPSEHYNVLTDFYNKLLESIAQ